MSTALEALARAQHDLDASMRAQIREANTAATRAEQALLMSESLRLEAFAELHARRARITCSCCGGSGAVQGERLRRIGREDPDEAGEQTCGRCHGTGEACFDPHCTRHGGDL